MPALRIEKLTKTYGSFTAIESIDLSIPDGALYVLLGPSGCGKSTTLNCIAGLEDATSGRVLLGARDITRLAPHQRDIAMVFQSSLLYPHLTGIQNIRMGLRGGKADSAEIEARISRTVDMLDIAKLLTRKPGMMSGGERQRVAMAKAIVRDPSAFLMDEPLAALDAALRQSLRADLVHLQKQLGVTTIFVTHDQVEAMTMGDMIVVMNNGRIEQVGTPQEIYEHPKTRFVAGFLGSPPMNFIKGHLVLIDGAPVFRARATDIVVPVALLSQFPADGREVELGIRPQHLGLSDERVAGSVPATVYAVERLGKENVVVLEDEEKRTLRALTDPATSAKIGDQLFLIANVAKGHIFS